jgi:hypothetical protein
VAIEAFVGAVGPLIEVPAAPIGLINDLRYES